jgi:hypothetical protein
MPADNAGIIDIGPILITPDARTYVYEYGRTLSDLYLHDGLKQSAASPAILGERAAKTMGI